MDCKHTITQGREGESGSWCNSCGEKVLGVDDRECKDCASAKKLINGWICSKHLMAISHDMHVTFRISEGTCWTPSNVDVTGPRLRGSGGLTGCASNGNYNERTEK